MIAGSVVPGSSRFLYEHIIKNAFFQSTKEWDKHLRGSKVSQSTLMRDCKTEQHPLASTCHRLTLCVGVNDISEDCSVPGGLAKELRPLTHGAPREIHVQRKAKIEPQPAEAQPVEEVKEDSSQNCSDSENSSSSHSSSTTEAENIESDLESLKEHHYSDLRRYTVTLERAFSAHLNSQQLNNQEWQGGRGGTQRFLTLPTTWPMARLMFSIRKTLLQTYCFEIEVTCTQAREQDAFVRRMALHLTQYLAVFLSETITVLLQRVLTHPARGPVDDTNAALLTQKFWVQAIYTELLCASSRHRAVREQEK